MLAKSKVAEPNIVNGINVDNLTALVEGVRKDTLRLKYSDEETLRLSVEGNLRGTHRNRSRRTSWKV